jgi:hypothetical protein
VLHDKFIKESSFKSYKTVFHSTDSESLLTAYAALLSHTYGQEITRESLYYKHIQNPLGESVIVYATDKKGFLVAARSLWLVANDTGVAYQPCDTVTHKEHRGKGLFTHLTKLALSRLPMDSLVFNFPNNKSLPGYLKMGWSVHSNNSKRFSFALPINKKINRCISELLPENISDSYLDYLVWRYPANKYKFLTVKGNILISNGVNSGILVTNGKVKRYTGGISKGYRHGPKVVFEIFLCGFSVFIGSNSKTAFLENTGDSFKKLDSFVGKSDINIFMDTF